MPVAKFLSTGSRRLADRRRGRYQELSEFTVQRRAVEIPARHVCLGLVTCPRDSRRHRYHVRPHYCLPRHRHCSRRCVRGHEILSGGRCGATRLVLPCGSGADTAKRLVAGRAHGRSRGRPACLRTDTPPLQGPVARRVLLRLGLAAGIFYVTSSYVHIVKKGTCFFAVGGYSFVLV